MKLGEGPPSTPLVSIAVLGAVVYSINLVSSNFVRSRDLLQQVSPGPENTWVEASTILFSVCMIVSPVRISVWVFMSIKVESVCVSLLAAFSTNIKS